MSGRKLPPPDQRDVQWIDEKHLPVVALGLTGDYKHDVTHLLTAHRHTLLENASLARALEEGNP